MTIDANRLNSIFVAQTIFNELVKVCKGNRKMGAVWPSRKRHPQLIHLNKNLKPNT